MRDTSTNVLVDDFIAAFQQRLDGRCTVHTLQAYAPQKTLDKLR